MHRPRVGRHGGALAGSSAAASRWQGVAGDLEGGTGEVLGKEERAGAHRNGVPTARRRKRRRAAAFNGGWVALVVVDKRGEVLQLEGDPGLGGSGQLRNGAARRALTRGGGGGGRR
jgi:hypothetical protein